MLIFNFQFSIFNWISGVGTEEYGEGSLIFCTMDFAFELILSLFYRKKEKQKKLAAYVMTQSHKDSES